MQAYARARGTVAMPSAGELVAELCDLPNADSMMFSRQVMRMARRHAWRTRMAWRSGSLSRILRHTAKALGDKYAGRAKVEGKWVVRARVDGQVVDVVRVVLPPVHRIEDFVVPLEVTLLREDILARSDLEFVLVMPTTRTPPSEPS